MDFLDGKINQLVVSQHPKLKNTVRTFATKPNRALAKSLGKIFGLIEIESASPQLPAFIDLIIEEIKNNYYHPKGLKTLTFEQEIFDLGQKFEAALKKTNLAIATFIETQQISLNLEKINILIGVSHNLNLHFTVSGNINAYLFYNLSRDNYRIINVLEPNQPFSAPIDPLKFFSQVISGRLRPKDFFFITTSNLFDYFSLEKLKKILTEQESTEGIENLKQLLEKIEVKKNFGLLTLELDKILVPAKKTFENKDFDYQKAASKDSMIALIKTEQDTQKLLTPSVMPEIKKYASSLQTAFKNYLNIAKTTTETFYRQKNIVLRPPINLPKISNLKPKFNFGPKIDINSKFKRINSLSDISRQKIYGVYGQLINSPRKILFKLKNLPAVEKIFFAFQKYFNHLLIKFKALPKSSQILLIITIILGVLFLNSLIWLGLKNSAQKRFETNNQFILDAENKKNEALATLIYRDENQARLLLIQAKELITSLKGTTKSQQNQVGQLISEISNELSKLQHLTEIAEPIQIINFQNLDAGAKIAPFAVLNQKILYTQNQRNKALYQANLDRRIVTAFQSVEINPGILIFGVLAGENEMLFISEEKKAFSFNPINQIIKPLKISISHDDKIIDSAFFNNRLYLLNSAKNQIDRYPKAADGFDSGANWLSEPTDLSKGVALTVDGAVYILKNNGEIAKFQNGKSVEFNLDLIDPKLSGPTKIKTTENSKYLYLLDPPTKRLVVIDKEGNLIKQYTSAVFDNLKDFIFSEADKKIYLLSASTVFGIPANHLK